VKDVASELTHVHRDRVWSRLNRALCIFIALGVLIPMLYQSLPMVKEKAVLDGRIAAMESKLEQVRMLNTRRTREVNLIQNDPEYAGIIARDRLDLMREGETIFRMDRRGR
jgi:cell division protein FtsB